MTSDMVKEQEGASQTMLVIQSETSKRTQWLPVSLRSTTGRARQKQRGRISLTRRTLEIKFSSDMA